MIRKAGIGSHQSPHMLKDEWLTPPEIIKELGPFDLDPCAPINRPWDTAKKHYTSLDNGLLQNWEGFVWCNPPYGKHTGSWLGKMALHNNGIALIFARTETAFFFNYVWPVAQSVLFIKGRLTFYNVDGIQGRANGGAPSVLIAYGNKANSILSTCLIKGKYIKL